MVLNRLDGDLILQHEPDAQANGIIANARTDPAGLAGNALTGRESGAGVERLLPALVKAAGRAGCALSSWEVQRSGCRL